MAVHRRHLPLAYQCDGFVPAPGSSGDGGFCERCQERVHDVSAMRESELRRLLAAHAGGTVCLSYRTDARGQVLLRPEPAAVRQPLAVGALASLLAACAGHMGELEIPGSVCRDEDGYAVTCPEWSDPEMLSVPEGHEATPDCESQGEGCPVRSTAPVGEVSTIETAEGSISVGMVVSPPIASPPLEPLPVPVPAVPGEPVPGAEPSSATLRANFSIDPYEGLDHLRGIIVIEPVASGRPHFVPTKQLWREWRERRAERKAQNERWRAAQRETAKR